jgi:hypothetical protein
VITTTSQFAGGFSTLTEEMTADRLPVEGRVPPAFHLIWRFTTKEYNQMEAYRFGKNPPKVDYRTLRFKDYLTPRSLDP